MMRFEMLETRLGCPDGYSLYTYYEGACYTTQDSLAVRMINNGYAKFIALLDSKDEWRAA